MKERAELINSLPEMSAPTLAQYLHKVQISASAGVFAVSCGLVEFGISAWAGINSTEEFYKYLNVISLTVSTTAIILGTRLAVPSIDTSRRIISHARNRGLTINKIPRLPFFREIEAFENNNQAARL